MYVCMCNAFTDRHVRAVACQAEGSTEGVYRALGVAPKCGRCIPTVADILRELTQEPVSVTA